MGTISMHSEKSRRKRSFSLPSFRKSSGQHPVETNVEEMARTRRAAAWQWYTRGVGEVVTPTRISRPAPVPSDTRPPALIHVDGTNKGGDFINDGNKKQEQQKPLRSDQPQTRAPSRFKAEASTARPTTSEGRAVPSPLYDEFELSGLRTHMADFVQRLQKQEKSQDELSLQAATSGDQKTKPQPPAGATIPAAASSSPFHRPLTVLNRFLRKVISGSLMKNTQSPPTVITTPSPAVQEPVAPLDEEEDTQYHYHHYIHHHHHHYHYGHSPEERASIIRRRRHSESSGIRPRISAPWEEVEIDYGEGEEEEEEEESPIQAYLARRRRFSDSFAGHNSPKKAVSDAEDERDPLKRVAAMQLPRRYNSERFVISTSPNKMPMDGRLARKGSKYDIDGEILQKTDIRSRRRHSADILAEGGSLNRKSGEGCRSTGGELKTARSTYKLGGAHGGGAAPPTTQVPGRRHSDIMEASYRREMKYDHMGMKASNRTPTPSPAASKSGRMMKTPMTPMRQSLSGGRHFEEWQLSVPASANANLVHPRPRDAALPPMYPQTS